MSARVQTFALWAIALTCLFLASLAVFSGSDAVAGYRRDVENNRQYCEADGEASERQNTKDCQGFLYRTLDDPVALFTAALTFATVALFGATFGLFFYAARQAAEARAAVNVARENAAAQLRAYVGPTRIYFRAFTHSEPISVAVEIKNFGTTPAYDYRTALWLEVHPYPVPFPRAFTASEATSTYAAGSLMPGNESRVICELPRGLPGEMLAAIRTEKFALYVCGGISYKDVFGKEQWTGVRKLALGRRIETEAPFIDAPKGNDAT